MKRIIVICLFILILTNLVFSADNKIGNMQVPKNIKILSQSCTICTIFLTVIDLDNNEIVLIEYITNYKYYGKGDLINVIRTGMIVNPKEQLSYLGNDMPYKEKDKD